MINLLTLALIVSSAAIPTESLHAKSRQGLPGKVSSAPNKTQVSETVYIADRGAQRIVKVDNISGGGWVTLTASMLGLGSFPVSSVATDKQGRIYFCSNGVLHRVNSITGAGHVQMSLPANAGTSSQVYVRSNGWVYVTLGNSQVVAYDTVGSNAVLKWQRSLSGSPTPPLDMYVDTAGTVTLAAETVITGTGNGQYPGIIIEIKPTGNPLFYFPIVDLRGVSRDAKGRIFFACTYGIGRIDNINGAGYTMTPTTSPAVGCVVGDSKVYTTLPSVGKVGYLSLLPAASQVWFGTIGSGVKQFTSTVDVAVFGFNFNAL
ncbi:hypothetical protein [Armatimonas sp.]|uniref:hypothetical protein n=1 Tax=Armatimonas sp. TaxID=1872638 RepID=UPI00374D4477